MKKLIAACVAGAAVMACASPAFAQNPSEEAQKQAARLISAAISDRVGGAAPGSSLESRLDGSSVWGLLSLTNIEFDAGLGGNFDIDSVSLTGGADRAISENQLIGFALTYTNSSGDFGIGDFEDESLTVTPYWAYKVTDNFFWSAKAGISFGESKFESGIFTSEDEYNAYNLEIAANAQRPSEAWTLRGSVALQAASFDGDEWDTAVKLFGEVEHPISDTGAFYANLETAANLDSDNDDLPVQAGVGLTFRPDDMSEFSVGYQTQLNVDDIDVNTFLITGRKKF